MTKIDYKELLIKYINHIGSIEGVSFINERYKANFNDDEWKELVKLDEEANEREKGTS